jgi:hypothetical protein
MKKSICIIIFLLLVVSELWAQSGLVYGDLMQNPGWSSRAAGLGGAYTGVADPTGLNIDNPAANAALQRFLSIATCKYRTTSVDLQTAAGNITPTYDMQYSGQVGLVLLGFASPLRLGKTKAVAGIYLRDLADLKAEYVWRNVKPAQDRTQETEIKRQGALYGLTAVFAWSPLRPIDLGLGLTMLGGSQRIDTTYVELASSGRSSSQTHWENRFSGLCFEISALWEISQNLHWGQKLIFPCQITFKDMLFSSSLSKRTFSDELNLEWPLTFNSGISWKPQTHVMINADYHLRSWERIRAQWGDRSLPLDFSNAHSWHLGVEYRLSSNRRYFPLRLGFFNSPKQLYEYQSSTPQLRGNQVQAKVITAGFGFHAGSLQIDASLAAESFSYPSDWYQISDLPVTINQRNYHFSLTLIYLL